MKKKAARRLSLRTRLLREHRRTLRDMLAAVSARLEPHPTGRFITCWSVHGRPVTQALDDQGQVWERVWRKATATTPEESFWEPLSMERRDKDMTTRVVDRTLREKVG